MASNQEAQDTEEEDEVFEHSFQSLYSIQEYLGQLLSSNLNLVFIGNNFRGNNFRLWTFNKEETLYLLHWDDRHWDIVQLVNCPTHEGDGACN